MEWHSATKKMAGYKWVSLGFSYNPYKWSYVPPGVSSFNCFLRPGWTRILSEQVSADENGKFFGVLSCPMVTWPPVFTLACSESAPRWLKKMVPTRFTWKKKPVALPGAPGLDMNLQLNTMPGTGTHTQLMGGGGSIGPQKTQLNHRISMVKLRMHDCITISYVILE